jgi:hypothetical protein
MYERTLSLRRSETRALIGMVPGLGLGGVADEIQRRDLFPP